MCCKGEYTSMYLMLRALKLFSQSSGLKANVSKSAIYTCAMNEAEIQRVVDASGFMKSILSFRYLEVPIFSKKMSKA